MKKLLFLLSIAIMSLCVQAQVATTRDMKSVPSGIMKHGQMLYSGMNRFNNVATATRSKVPMRKVELAQNEKLLGLYTSDEYSENGIAIKNQTATFKVFSIIPASYYTRLSEGDITAIRFALAAPCQVNSVFVYGVTADDYIVTLTETATGGQTFNKGWNTVKLTTPCPLTQTNITRIAIGYEYVEKANLFPVSLIEGYSDEGFCFIGDLGQGESVYNGSTEGLLSVQAIVQVDNLPAVDVSIEDLLLQHSTVAAGSQMEFAFSTYNFGSDNVDSYEIEVKMDGQLVKTVTEKDMAMPTTAKFYVGTITLPNDIKRGSHTLSAELSKVNGAAPATGKDDDFVSTTFTTYMPNDVVARQKFLIEELTSHSCTYCPNGAALIDVMLDKRDDLAVVCIHGNQSSKDPFNTPECQSLLAYVGTAAFPSATFNRIYFGSQDGIAPGIGYSGQYDKIANEFIDIMEQESLPAFASVNIDKQLSADGNTLTINVSGEGGAEANQVLEDYSLTVYVVEDSLKYRQLNNGAWISNYMHKHVLRKVATAINGDDINWTSPSTYTNTYEVALDETWQRNHLSIVAFISRRQSLDRPDWTDMAVTNANSVEVMENNGGGGNNDDDTDERVDVGLRITPFTTATQLMGESMSLNAKYVTGLNYGTNNACIWNTETNEFINFTAYDEGMVHAINSDGTAVGSTVGYGGKALICYADGTSTTLEDNGGTNTQGADAWCISEDGKTIGGFYYYFEWTDAAQTEGFYATFPCVWQDKKCINLLYPTKAEMGFNVDGAGLRWMSADGSVLLGYLVDDKATWPAIIWRKNAQGDYECDPICKDYFEAAYKKGKPYMMFNPCALSANGEWVALIIQDEFDDSDFSKPMPITKVARLNLKTGKLEILEAGQPMGANSIADDGSVLLYTNVDGIFGRIGYIWKAGETTMTCLDDMLSKVKGMPEFGANVPASFAADNKTIMGFGIDQDANIFSYVVNLDDVEKALNNLDAIEEVMTETNVSTTNGNIFTITGQKVNSMKRPGLYIVNGKKILVK